MTFEEIITFITIVEQGSITKAAEILCLSQSAVSNRLNQLENQLEMSLISRGKGRRLMRITPQGEKFLPIAQQWIELWKMTSKIKHGNENLQLRIGSIDIVNNFMFVPTYRRMITTYPEVHISLFTHHSSEIHSLLHNRVVDIGFVFSHVTYRNIISRPVCKEPIVLVCRNDSPYTGKIDFSMLDECDEVFLNWGPDYKLWHDRFWDPSVQNKVTINTGSMMANFLLDSKSWGLVPISVAKYLQKMHNIYINPLIENPPFMTCYELTHRYPADNQIRAIKLFNDVLSFSLASKENADLISLL